MKLNINVEGLLFVKYIFGLTMFGSIVYKFFRIFPTETCVCYGLAVYMVSYFAVSFFNITFDHNAFNYIVQIFILGSVMQYFSYYSRLFIKLFAGV